MYHHPDVVELLPLLIPRSTAPVSFRIQVTLERGIALGLFPEGRLPSERQLASTLDVSRTALRAALEQVRASGYAERSLVGRAGGVPTSTVRRLSPAELRSLANQALAEIGDLMAIRRFLEPACARAAATERSPERLERLIAIQQRLTDDPSPLVHRTTDRDFHGELAAASGTESVSGVLLRVRADLMRWRDRLPMEDTVGHSATEHAAIIEAVGAGDPDAAEAAARAHIDTTEELLALFFRRYVDQPEVVRAEGEAAIARFHSGPRPNDNRLLDTIGTLVPAEPRGGRR